MTGTSENDRCMDCGHLPGCDCAHDCKPQGPWITAKVQERAAKIVTDRIIRNMDLLGGFSQDVDL